MSRISTADQALKNLQLTKLKARQQKEMTGQKRAYNQELVQLKNDHQIKLDTQIEKNQKLLQSLKKQNLKLREMNHQELKKIQSTKRENLANDLQRVNEDHRRRQAEMNEKFKSQMRENEKYFSRKLQEQNEHLKEMERKNDSILNGVKASLAKELLSIQEKEKDPFFQRDILSPVLTTLEDRVEISCKVPHYAKKNLRLTINDKEAQLHLDRSFRDQVDLPDGTTSKINKVESFTSVVPTPYHLDPKSVQSSFKDGVMTFVIKKT